MQNSLQIVLFQRFKFEVGNWEIPQSLWPISLIFPWAPEKVTQKM